MQITSLANCATGFIGVLAFVVSSYAADRPQIGSGQPGLKIATRAPGSIVIYEDEPSTVGVGLMGGMATRKIRVLIDQNYHFSKDRIEIPEQLYPLDPDAVFTSSGGTWTENFHRWEYTARTYVGYRARGSEVDLIPDIQAAARRIYSLRPDDVFLGAFDNLVFFWSAFDPSHVFWRRLGDNAVFEASLPRNVIDIYGATRGIRKDVGFVVFAKARGLIVYAPYETEFVELSLSKGVRVHAP
jgi:hypothetical protein